MTHVGFILPLESNWMGGQTYLYNLVSSFLESQRRPGTVKAISILYASERVPTVFSGFDKRHEIQLVACPELKNLRTSTGLVKLLAVGNIRAVSKKLDALGLDVVFSPALYLGHLRRQKVVTWLPDFQHRALPRFFSFRQRLLREMSYRLCIRASDKLMLSSQDAARMFSDFYGVRSAHKLNIVPFTPTIDPLSHAEVLDVLTRYDLEPGFFFLPNQFWRHKNHELAITALEKLYSEDWNGCLIMTGTPICVTNAHQSTPLLKRISRLQSNGRVRHLGSVPRHDFIALLQASGCLINPSRFEGRSSTVEEAIAFDIPMLLSSLAIHREQAGTKATYFDVDDAVALAAGMTRNYPSVVRTQLATPATNRAEIFSQALVRALEFDDPECSSKRRTGYVSTETIA